MIKSFIINPFNRYEIDYKVHDYLTKAIFADIFLMKTSKGNIYMAGLNAGLLFLFSHALVAVIIVLIGTYWIHRTNYG